MTGQVLPNRPASRNSRISFAKIREVEDLPDLLEIQKRSYRVFPTERHPFGKRQNIGLQSILNEVHPIISSANYF